MHKESVSAFHQGVEGFKKQLLQTTLEAHRGNRTHAARALGLQRTYLVRLMRDFDVRVPPRMKCADADGE
jgi:DNA-binding NtrC family response regulator